MKKKLQYLTYVTSNSSTQLGCQDRDGIWFKVIALLEHLHHTSFVQFLKFNKIITYKLVLSLTVQPIRLATEINQLSRNWLIVS